MGLSNETCRIDFLYHYQTITTFDQFVGGDFGKRCGKMRNCSSPAISPFPTMFSPLSEDQFSNSSHSEMASETPPVRDCLNFFSTIFGKGLNKQKFDLARSQTSDSSLPSHEWDNPMNKLAYIENSVWKRTCVMSNVNSIYMYVKQ